MGKGPRTIGCPTCRHVTKKRSETHAPRGQWNKERDWIAWDAGTGRYSGMEARPMHGLRPGAAIRLRKADGRGDGRGDGRDAHPSGCMGDGASLRLMFVAERFCSTIEFHGVPPSQLLAFMMTCRPCLVRERAVSFYGVTHGPFPFARASTPDRSKRSACTMSNRFLLLPSHARHDL